MAVPPLVDMLRDLVATPSVSATDRSLDQPNRPVVELLRGWAESLGFECEIVPLPSDPDRKANLVATLGAGEGGLVFSGHTDTVPYDADQWSYDPFELTAHQGNLYGLGTTDMKGFFAAVLDAVRGIPRDALREPLILVATADEECGMEGARALLDAGRPRARVALVGEPTGLRPIRKHKGIFVEELTLEGRSGHSSNPDYGVSALEGMLRVLDSIRAWRRELQSDHFDGSFEVPEPTLNLGRIEGGDSANRICARCTLAFDLRSLPRMSVEALRAQLRTRVEEVIEGSGLGLSFASGAPGIDAFETEENAEVVRVMEELTGAKAGAVMFATECPFFQKLGIEPVIVGPGDIAVAHQADEYVTEQALHGAVDLYRRAVHRFCMEDG